RVEAIEHFPARQAGDNPSDDDVLAAGEVVVEARSELEQRPETSVRCNPALRRPTDATDEAQQCRLSGAILADDAERPSPPHPNAAAAYRPEGLRRLRSPPPANDALGQGARAFDVSAEELADILDNDRVRHYVSSTKSTLAFVNMRFPRTRTMIETAATATGAGMSGQCAAMRMSRY